MSDETEDQEAMADDWAAAMEEQATEEAGGQDAADDWAAAMEEQATEEAGGQGAADDWAAAMEEQATEEAGGQGAADDWAAAMEEQVSEEAAASANAVQLDELTDEGTPVNDPKLDVILDIPVTLSMEVGQTDIPISNLLQLNQGSVVELDRIAGEPLDVMVNGTLIAHGEVVVVNDRYGIRLTDVISPQERIRRLK